VNAKTMQMVRFASFMQVCKRGCYAFSPSPGLKTIDKPPVFVFSELSALITCGITQFVVPEAKLHLLAMRDPASV